MRDSKYWNGEREDERALRKRLGSWRDKAACVASVVLEALGVVFAFAAVAALVKVLCA